MKTYIFKTTATMKEYNNKKWWIASDIIKDIEIKAENIKQALQEYKSYVWDQNCIEISNNALKNKNPMYIDTENETKQVGFVITGKTEFEDSENYKWSQQYIDLWVTVLTVVDTDFEN